MGREESAASFEPRYISDPSSRCQPRILKGRLTHWHYDTFEIQWEHDFPWFGKGTVQFLLDAAGKVAEMKMDVPNEDFWFTELELKKKEPPKEQN